MPKPTFFQSVLRKPTRSYADPLGASPWADHVDHYDDGYEAGPSRSRPRPESRAGGLDERVPRTRGPSSTLSSATGLTDSPSGPSRSTSFPRPAKKAPTSVILRNGEIVHLPSGDGQYPATTPKRKKKKKKAPPSMVDDAETESMLSVTSSVLSRPPPIRSQYSDTSSTGSSATAPISPTRHIQVVAQKRVIPSQSKLDPKNRSTSAPLSAPTPRPLLTPPSSEMSSLNSSTQSVSARPLKLTSIPPPLPLPAQSGTRPISTVEVDETDDEDQAFYTPRSSLDLTPDSPQEEDTPRPPAVHAQNRGPIITAPPPPSFNFLPPTPAPMPDPPTSPFHHLALGNNSSSYSDRPVTRSPSPTLHPQSAVARVQIPDTDEPAEVDEGTESASGQVGSDEEDEPDLPYRTGRQASIAPSAVSSRRARSQGSQLPMVSKGTPASSADGRRSDSRQSTTRHLAKNSFEDFVVRQRRPSRPASEASFGESGRGGSISGYGKGGWAAAAAASANGGRSGATSPVMFMPTGGDGWAEFHQPPPRQSRFTPLPASSQSPTFDRLVNGDRRSTSAPGSRSGTGASTPASFAGLRPPSRSGDSSPSEYSQLSDGLPVPSRSYLKQGDSDETSRTPSEVDYSQEMDEHRSHSGSRAPAMGSIPFPQARVQSPISDGPLSPIPRPASRATSHSVSRPMSPDPYYPTGSPVVRAQSPVSPRPASRAGFEPPSFLNPDLLTILPEMSHEDSDRLYRPGPARSEGGWGRKTPVQDGVLRRASVFRAKSEAGHARGYEDYDDSEDEQDEVRELPPQNVRRSKSVMGFRQSGSNWEGSSYGDGVLMESHGRAQEVTGGYTNLILPSGAYRPVNPAKAASELNSRILGLPHATMASITLNSTAHRFAATPAHLRTDLPPLVDFSSHLKPPTKVGNAQLLMQVYAVAIDQTDVRALNDKTRGDVGRWVPGRSFVGRCLAVGADEKEVVRGDIVMGLVDVRKSGISSEYIVIDRRRISRAPFPTQLTLEQLSLLPLQGISAARAVRTHLNRHSRALISGANTGVPALICQELSRAGVNVTAVIPGGDDSHATHTRCLENGARGVLMGSLAAVMLSLDEGGWDLVLDDKGGQRVYDAARRLLKDGGKLLSTVRPESTLTHAPPHLSSRPSGLKSLRAAFGSRRKDSKHINFEYIQSAGSGEPEVDTSGMDCRDVMEEGCMAVFRPVLEASLIQSDMYAGAHAGGGMDGDAGLGGRGVEAVVPFEKGPEVFRANWTGVRVIRLIN